MHSVPQFVWSRKLDWDKYLRPRQLSEALHLLDTYRGKARVIAGGTDLLIQIRKREVSPRVLVDITGIRGLDTIALEDGLIRMGPLVTHQQAATSSLLREKAMALSQGASWVGSLQIRNLGTIGGNIVSGQPGADATIPLLALDAKVKVSGLQGERIVSLSDLLSAPGKTGVDSTSEIVTEIFFDALKEGETSFTLRLARRKALALPILVASLVLSVDPEKRQFRYAKIALGPVAPVPFRAKEAEKILASAPIEEEVIREAAQRAAQESNPRTNPLRGSSQYRKEMVAVLVERALKQALRALEVKHA